MSVDATIDSVAQTTLQPNWGISATVNGVDSFNGDVLSLDASNRPAIDKELIVTDLDYPGTSTIRIFGGLIVTPTETGFGGTGASVGINTRVSATDFNALAERRCLYGSRPAETLAARLTWIATYLADFGVTLDAPVGSPTLAAHDYNNDQASKVLDDLTTETGGQYVHEIDYSKVLRMSLLGSVSAPFDIVDGVSADFVEGDIEVTPTRNNYANRVTGRYDGDSNVTDTWTVGAGPQTDFNLSKIHLANPGYLTIDGVTDIDMASNGWGVFESSLSPSGWLLRKISTTVGWVVEFTYTSKFMSMVVANDVAEQTANKLWEIPPIDLLNVFNATDAQALVEMYLDQRKQVRKSIKYTTRKRGLKPGMTQTVTVSKRNLDGTFLITGVDTVHVNGQAIDRHITAIEGEVLLSGSWREAVAQMLGGGTSSGSSGTITAVMSPGGTVGGGRMIYQLTGEGVTSVQDPTPTWVAASAMRVRIDSAKFGLTGSVTLRLKAFDAGVTVQARLRDVTNSATAGTSAYVTSTSWQTVAFAVAMSAGVADYEIQLLPSVANADVSAVGFLES